MDSVAALVPRSELEGEIGQLQGESGFGAGHLVCGAQKGYQPIAAGTYSWGEGWAFRDERYPGRYATAFLAPRCMLPLLLPDAVGAQARLMSGALRKLSGNASKHNCTVIFLNQLRHKVLGCRSHQCTVAAL